MAMAMGMKSIAGDAHFFEESMNLDRIRKLLDNKLGVAGHSEKLEAMKALLASISKGEDVSPFFADVVKNVIVASVEVKKLVYMYLVHYADANAQCRELALLSINSFQKDLADPNQLIRALALRVMTSIRVRDIVQIQLIAIRKCAADSSAYVRKCATNAISKVFVLDPEQKDVLAEIIGELLNDPSTMVLGSAVQALNEVCPDRLDLLHRPFRKLCHLLADVDEWGQTVMLHVLLRYCRQQFQAPVYEKKEVESSKKSKKGFYADEGSGSEDESKPRRNKQAPFMLGKRDALPSVGSVFSNSFANSIGDELEEDHRLVLRSSIPLLKSRNSAVVLAVATLHYYCGTHSLATSTLIGKSLVRIMRNQREIQYVVLTVISSMATSRPGMFCPFLPEFFVRATDPAYARKLKLEILTSLVTRENVSIILREFQAYVQHVDKSFVTTTVQALGRVADTMPSVAERSLNGLMRLVRSSNDQVVAESVVVIRQLLHRQTIEMDRLLIVRSLAAMMVSGRISSPSARASILWMLGEFNDNGNGTTCAAESLRMLVKDFSNEATQVRLQLLNLSVKLGLREPQARTIQLLLQYVIELCKFDIDYDVRDRARLIRAALSGDANLVNPHKLFASKKLAPLIGYDDDAKTRFMLGSLSNVVHHSVPGYLPLPEWRSTKPDRSLREESSFVVNTNRSSSVRSGSKAARKKTKEKNSKGFYSDESSSSSKSSESGSESDSDASSESGSSEASESKSDLHSSNAESEKNVSSSEESESEASSKESESDASSENDAQIHRREKGRKALKHSQSKATKSVHAFDPLHVLNSQGVAPADSQAATPMASTTNLLDDLMGLCVSSSTMSPRRYELLTSLAGNGLDIQYAFLRQPSSHSPEMNAIQLWLANHSKEPIARVHIIGTINLDQVVSFPELPVLFPGGSTSIAQLQVDFHGRLDTVPLEVITSTEKFRVDLCPLIGELLLPQQLSLDDFERRISQTDSTCLHTCEITLPAPVEMNAAVQAVQKECNMAQVYEINYMNGVMGKCKFAGRFRSGNDNAEIVLMAVEVQLQSGKGQLLVVMRDSVLAQRLSTAITQALSTSVSS